MADIVFLDTETLGLDINAPIWEFAAILRQPDEDVDPDSGAVLESEMRIFIQNDPSVWLESLPARFVADYMARYDETEAFCGKSAARSIATFIGDAHVIACNPVFDDPRLAQLLRANGVEPRWHYHPDDITSIVKGFLAARKELPPPPWRSEELSRAIGVDPAEFERHTAMGDVLWVRAQYDAVMGGAR
ncbi:3'-5' exoribonuclease [Mycolicibacterium komossense]|uniref:Exonuclease domain-containing protein n=1 Tax=Mycolicibacterium komossense TaxID=1779 RepID=A0ABT3CMD4_9MYCO|nr:3'-5' exoribonuclease [Mycolicibacterium komossense]MCV7230708.1 hypothetical protein [Mycolicibacterium komossense]